MFGFATLKRQELMPAIHYAPMRSCAVWSRGCARDGTSPDLAPDAKKPAFRGYEDGNLLACLIMLSRQANADAGQTSADYCDMSKPIYQSCRRLDHTGHRKCG